MHGCILITGGSGFIGSHLALACRAAFPGARVVALDNLRRRGSALHLPRLEAAGVDFVHGDVRNAEDLAQVPAFDLLLDCAAEPSVAAGYSGGAGYMINANLLGTVNALEAAARHGADVVFLSTSRVYPYDAINGLAYEEQPTRFGLDTRRPSAGVSARGIDERFPLDGPRSLYGATKLCCEHLLVEYAHMHDLRVVINRCGVVAGPWQMGHSEQGVVVHWVVRHVLGGRLDYIGFGGAGKQVRDVLHVDDLCRLVCLQIASLPAGVEIYNVGGGGESSVSLRELTKICRDAAGRRLDIGSVARDRPGDVIWYVTDTALVERAFGWRPARPVADTVDDVARWVRDRREMLAGVLG